MATVLSASVFGSDRQPTAELLAFGVLALILFAHLGLYRPRFTLGLLDELRLVAGGTTIAAFAVTFVAVAVADRTGIAAGAAVSWAFATATVCTGRIAINARKRRLRAHGVGGRRTLILGAGNVGTLVAKRLEQRPEFGLSPVAFLDPAPLLDRARLPVIGRAVEDGNGPLDFVDTLESGIREFEVDHIVVTFSLMNHETELALMRRCQELGVGVSLVPRLFEGIPDRTELERVGGLPLISVYPTDPKGWQFGLKYTLDRLFAAVALVVTAPILLAAMAGTLLTIGRPVFYRQRRVGMDGQEFDLFKLRTMRGKPNGNDGQIDPAQSNGSLLAPGGVEGEDRRTRFGKILRRFSIDELPQLVNVLRGEMSLIGPRPERPGFSGAFTEVVHRYADRHRVKSGITGWAQVHRLRGRTSVADRAEWDNYYIENWSLWLDLKIALMTCVAVFRDRVE